MNTEFFIESDGFSQAEKDRLRAALAGLAQGDAPFVYEIVFVGEEEMRELNARMRGIDAVTDVLSFPSTENAKGEFLSAEEHGECLDEEGRLFLGSIAICTRRAEEQAQEYGHSYERELFYLAVHGALHCLGYDHMTEAEKREMRAKEEEVMSRMNLRRD